MALDGRTALNELAFYHNAVIIIINIWSRKDALLVFTLSIDGKVGSTNGRNRLVLV